MKHFQQNNQAVPPYSLQPQQPDWNIKAPQPPPELLGPLIEAADAVGLLVQYRHQASALCWQPPYALGRIGLQSPSFPLPHAAFMPILPYVASHPPPTSSHLLT